ncbi:MAG: peptidylprolyl isomerase [Chthoniobacteraceae bacterium]
MLSLAGVLRASDLPTLKVPLPDISSAQGSPVASIDLRTHFEVTSIIGQVVQFRTTVGTVNLEMLAASAPVSVANFLSYANASRYVSTIVHRSDKSLGVIQGGGYALPTLGRIATFAPIALEYNLPNARGTIAMARTSELNSATSEWFINTKDNTTTLGQSNGGGYAVFGRVTGTGMAVVDAIAALPTYVFASPFGQLPLAGYSGSGNVADSNFIKFNAVEAVPVFPAQAGQNAVVNFSVTNSNPALVSVAVSGSSLSASPVGGQSGFADVTVTATDSNGNSVQDTFRLTVVAGVPEIAIEQPAGTSVADGGSRAFPLVHVGSTADLVFTIRNPGNASLTLSGSPRVVLDGPDAGQFSVSAGPGSPLAGGSSTAFSIRFTPTSGGAKTAALHIANNDADENPYDIDLSGTANMRPVLSLPASPLIVEATGPAGAAVGFSVSASDAEDGALTPVVGRVSGSTFSTGDTTVGASAIDSAGATTTGSFVVRVLDTTAPQIGGTFAPLTALTDRTGKAALPDYTAQAVTSDIVGVTGVTQVPAAGTLLAAGTTTVTLTAHDAAGNTATVSFDVTIVPGTAALVMKNSAVPGAGVDPRIPAGAKFGTFGVPSITMNGGAEAGWLSTVTWLPLGSFSGVFSGPLDSPMLRLRTGEAATDAVGAAMTGVTFQSFRTPVFAGADFAMPATVRGTRVVSLVNDTGVWVNGGGTLRGIARAGSAAPGAGNAKFLAFTSVAMPAPGTVFFVGKLAAALTKDSGLWMWTSTGGTQLVLRKGTPIDVGAGPLPLLSFNTLSGVAGSAGHGRYDGSVPAIDVRLVFANSLTAIATITSDGSLQVTQRSGVTDGAGRMLKSIGVPSSPGTALAATALATFAPDATLGLTLANSRAIFDFESEAILAQTGVAAPGAGAAKFFAFQNPVAGFGAGGERVTTFGATLSGTTITRDTGLWAHTAAGLALLAREGSVPPGAPGTKWLGFTSLSVLEGRGPMFTAKLLQAPPAVTLANDTGFWATDSTGALQLLLRTGDRVGGKKVLRFTLLGSVSGSPGQRRAWTSGDDSARVIYRVFFTDGTSAIASTVVP